VQPRLADDLLLHQRHFLERQLDAQVAAGHHDGVRRVEDAAEIPEGRVLLDLGHELGRAGHQRPELLHVLGPAHEREGDIVHPERRRLRHVFEVLLGERRRAHLDAGKIHPLV
jgi:hypothetical protein